MQCHAFRILALGLVTLLAGCSDFLARRSRAGAPEGVQSSSIRLTPNAGVVANPIPPKPKKVSLKVVIAEFVTTAEAQFANTASQLAKAEQLLLDMTSGLVGGSIEIQKLRVARLSMELEAREKAVASGKESGMSAVLRVTKEAGPYLAGLQLLASLNNTSRSYSRNVTLLAGSRAQDQEIMVTGIIAPLPRPMEGLAPNPVWQSISVGDAGIVPVSPPPPAVDPDDQGTEDDPLDLSEWEDPVEPVCPGAGDGCATPIYVPDDADDRCAVSGQTSKALAGFLIPSCPSGIDCGYVTCESAAGCTFTYPAHGFTLDLPAPGAGQVSYAVLKFYSEDPNAFGELCQGTVAGEVCE